MSKYSELFPDQYVDGTGNTRIDGDTVSLNNALDVTETGIEAKQTVTFKKPQYNDDNLYFKNQLVRDSANLPDGYVTLGVSNSELVYLASKDFEGRNKHIDARALRIVDSTDFHLGLDDEFLALDSSASNPYIVHLPDATEDEVAFNVKAHYVGSVGTDTPHITLDAGNKEIVMHIRAQDGTLQEIYRDNTLLINTSNRQSWRYMIVNTDPITTEWHGTVGVSE